MAFINKKEQVIEIKLTQFGKTLLSKGGFVPKYYAFFDDDIIYDISGMGIQEEQNESQDRIKESIRLSLQHAVVGIETEYKKETKLIEEKVKDLFEPVETVPEDKESNLLLTNALGKSSTGAQEAPWFVLTQKGDSQFDSVTAELTYENHSNPQKIPQVEIETDYTIYVDRKSYRTPKQDFETFVDLMTENVEFLDGSSLRMDKQTLVFELIENNTDFTSENFEFELFEMPNPEAPEGEEKKLIKLENPEDFFTIKKDKSISNYMEVHRSSQKSLFTKE